MFDNRGVDRVLDAESVCAGMSSEVDIAQSPDEVFL